MKFCLKLSSIKHKWSDYNKFCIFLSIGKMKIYFIDSHKIEIWMESEKRCVFEIKIIWWSLKVMYFFAKIIISHCLTEIGPRSLTWFFEIKICKHLAVLLWCDNPFNVMASNMWTSMDLDSTKFYCSLCII